MNALPALINIRPASPPEWEEVLRSDDAATFFHTPAWYGIWKQYGGYLPHALWLEWENGQRAVLPFAVQHRHLGLQKTAWSSPAWNYGGVLAPETLEAGALTSLGAWLENRWRRFFLRENPFSANRLQAGRPSEDFTRVIDLRPGPEHILQNWSSRHRRALRQALRHGLTVRPAECDADWQHYYAAYLDSARRWKKPLHTLYRPELFATIRQNGGRLWLALRAGQILYGCLCFYFGSRVVYWHGAGFTAHLPLHPAHLLHFHILKQASESGCQCYDLNPSGGYAGVEQFKRELGSVRLRCDLWSR